MLQEDPDKSVRRDFLDVFHHRLLSLLYRELIRFRLWGEQTTDLRDRWACRLMALAGFDVYDEPLKLRIHVSLLLKLAPLLAQQSRTAGALKIALEEVLGDELGGAEIIVREFAGSWTEIETESQTRLGERNSELGRTALLGRLAFDRAGSLEIQIGPVARRIYERFLPTGDLMPVLQDALSLFLRDPLDHRVILELAKAEAPRLCLVSSGGNEWLGRNTWLGARTERTLITVYPYARENRPAESIAPSSAGYYSPPPSRGVARAG